ncbi:MAG: TonB-dependent receptor [Acidobacteriota bacterium]
MFRIKLSFILSLSLCIILSIPASGEPNVGIIQGRVRDTSGAVIVGARVMLSYFSTNYQAVTQTDEQGVFRFLSVPFNPYRLEFEAKGFQRSVQEIDVHSNAPLELDIQLEIANNQEVVEITASASDIQIEADKTASETGLSTQLVERAPTVSPARAIQSLVSTAPGVAQDDGGRMHIRGAESGNQYLINGIPFTFNLSAIFSSGLDPRTVKSAEILTGGIPAEYGKKLSGIVTLDTKSGLNSPLTFGVSTSLGSFSTGDTAFNFAGHKKNFGFYGFVSGSTSQRYLDPPNEDNFRNFGRAVRSLFRLDYNPSNSDFITATLLFGGSNFQVPNRLDQQFSRQQQQQQLRDHSEFVSWQHIFTPKLVSNISLYHSYSSAQLRANAFSIPVVANQDRNVNNYGLLAALSYTGSRHTLKGGLELTRTPIRERFSFFVTDFTAFPAIEDDAGNLIAENPAVQFTAANPFRFRAHQSGREFSFYLQDHVELIKNLTLDAGVRYDNYKLLTGEQQLSPRLGIAYYIPSSSTVLRFSFNRLFQTPPVENLLLSGSPQAATLSPGVVLGIQPFATVKSERDSVFEVGVQQRINQHLKLDIVGYRKYIGNLADKDQLLDTGIIFPIAISRGRATGLEARLDFANYHGFSGYISYANARVFAVTPIVGGLFLGEAIESFANPNQIFAADHDARNSGQFQIGYMDSKYGWWTSLVGRYDSGYPVELETNSRAEFAAENPDISAKILDEVDFSRGRVKPHLIFNLSAGIDLFRQDKTKVSLQFDIQNLTNRLYLYNFESVFSGTHIGFPRLYSGRLTVQFN